MIVLEWKVHLKRSVITLIEWRNMQIKFGRFLEVAVNCPPTPSDTTHTTNLELEDPIVENQAEEKI